MLTFTEEILLLLGDDEGAFLPIREHAFECVLAGAVLLDLAFAYRIDTDLESLVVINAEPTGHPAGPAQPRGPWLRDLRHGGLPQLP